MTKKQTLQEYIFKLQARGIKSIPIEELRPYNSPIWHRCECLADFLRAPAHMLGKYATGVCDPCSKRIKRNNKLITPDNGYLDYCKLHGFSEPIDIDDYVDRHTKILHMCNNCGNIWDKAPGKAKRKTYLGVCPDCTQVMKGLARRLTEEELVFSLKLITSFTLLSRGFHSATKKAYFICKCKKEFVRTPQKVLMGRVLCSPCSNAQRSINQAMSVKEHNIKMAEWEFQSKLLSKSIPNNHTELDYECQCGEPFRRKVQHMFKLGSYGLCATCSMSKKSASQSKTQDQYDEELKLLRPNILRLGVYAGHAVNIQHQCICGNTDWFPRPANILGSYDTCGCGRKKSEKVVRQIFEQVFQTKFPSKNPDFLTYQLTGKRLQLDGYNEDLKLAFEHHGSQHYGLHPVFHETMEDFDNQLIRDKEKLRMCLKAGVTIIVIPSLELKLRKLRTDPAALLSAYKEILKNISDKIVLPQNTPDKITIDWAKIDTN